MFLIKIAYWLGIGADALWAVALFIPNIFGILTGQPAFNPDLQVRLIMAIGGALMTGWTLLLLCRVHSVHRLLRQEMRIEPEQSPIQEKWVRITHPTQ